MRLILVALAVAALSPIACKSPEAVALQDAIGAAQEQQAAAERTLDAIDSEIAALLKKQAQDGTLAAADAVRLMDLQRERAIEEAYQRGVAEAITEARVEAAEESAGQGVRQGDKVLRGVGDGDAVGILEGVLGLIVGLGGTYVAVRRKLETRIVEESNRRDASRREMGLRPASDVTPPSEMVVTTRNLDRALEFMGRLPEVERAPNPPEGA